MVPCGYTHCTSIGLVLLNHNSRPSPPGVYRTGDYSYEGEWVDDKMQGEGKFQFASGAVYSGSWRSNKYEGHGQYTWPDGKRYEVRGQLLTAT